MKNYLKKLLAKRQAKLKDLQKRNSESEDLNEVRSLGVEIAEVTEEIRGLETQIAELETAENNDEGTEEERSANGFNPNQALNVVATATQNQGTVRSEEESPRSSMEYRKAFMEYVQRGTVNKDVLQFEARADATGTSTNLGVLIPETVIQEIIQGVEKVYGQLYSRVRKLNVKGGVKFPIGSFDATFKRITETTVSDRQNAGGITGSVTFTYNIGEIRLARTLLQTVLSVPVFEQEFAKVIVKAYVRAMDKEIMTGDPANNEMEGILTEAAKGTSGRIPSANVIEFTEAEMADWKSWQTKLFAKIPLSMRGENPEFVMTANTYEANIKTLKDDNNRPVYNETYNPVDGAEVSKFKGKNVVFVEEDILKNFDDAANGDYFGMYWVAEEAYGINSNMEFTVIDYFDQELNQYVKKALVINDGKILDPKYLYLLKKKISG